MNNELIFKRLKVSSVGGDIISLGDNWLTNDTIIGGTNDTWLSDVDEVYIIGVREWESEREECSESYECWSVDTEQATLMQEVCKIVDNLEN